MHYLSGHKISPLNIRKSTVYSFSNSATIHNNQNATMHIADGTTVQQTHLAKLNSGVDYMYLFFGLQWTKQQRTQLRLSFIANP